ncbi:DUF357 domain-containing protein [Candidatus Woesearchaeota archaeon]|nr:DUF357 domain-containing protein [Candidatus Woesearchaeota archaeon]
MQEIGIEKLEKYIKLTEKALKKLENVKDEKALILIGMSKNYYKDALHFKEKNDFVNAFAAINYAHAFLDSAALLKLIKVDDNKLFMVD